MKLYKFSLAIFALVLVSSVSGCAPPRIYSTREARKIFSQNKKILNAIVNLIRTCNGVDIIYADSDSNRDKSSACSNQTIAYRNEIVDLLNKSHVLWVTVGWRSDGKLDSLSFVLQSYGIVGSGSGSAIWYFSTPIAKHEKFNAGPNYALTTYPCRWFYVIFN